MESYDPDIGTFSVMDKVAFGLDHPKLALMQNGGVFVAGKPIITASAGTPAAAIQEKGSKSVRSLIAPQTLTGSGGPQEAVLGVTPLSGITLSMRMNQGVERVPNDSNDDPLLTGAAKFTWRKDVPRILNRNTLLYGNFFFGRSVSKDWLSKLHVKVEALLPDNITFRDLQDNIPLVWDGSEFPYPKGMHRLGFKVVIPSASTILNAKVKVSLLDPEGKLEGLIPVKGWSQTSDGVVWKDQPNPIQIIVVPVTIQYTDPSLPLGNQVQKFQFTSSELEDFKKRMDAALQKMFPLGTGGINYDLNTQNVSLVWDLGTKTATGYTPIVGKEFMKPLIATVVGDDYKVWKDLTQFAYDNANLAYQPFLPKQGGKFLCTVIKAIPGITQADGKPDGLTHSNNFNILDISHYFSVLDIRGIDAAHELGHAHGLGHTSGPYGTSWTWPTANIYGSQFQTESKIGVQEWDPFWVSGAQNTDYLHRPLNSNSEQYPIWGFQYFNPADETGVGTVRDLMDYVVKGKGWSKWISDYTFNALFQYNKNTN